MQEFATTALAMFLALFPITNPIGAVPIFYSLTADLPHHEQIWQARQTAFYSVVVLIVFLFTGPLILSFFGISIGVLKIAGGLLVGQTAWDMLTVRQRLTDPENQEAMQSTDVSLIPMAIPIVSGPGAIGIVIDLAPSTLQWLQYLGCMAGIFLVGFSLYFSLRSGKPIIHALGTHGIGAFNRILGFFILAISVQMISDGAFNLLQTHLTGLASSLPTDLISPLS